jgi:hypothetical protein
VSQAQRRERASCEAFERQMSRLHFELSMGTARRHLDVLLEFLESLLPQTGGSLQTESYARQLKEAHHRVSTRHNLRLLKGR